MRYTFPCDSGHVVEVDASSAGGTVACPTCGKAVRVPRLSQLREGSGLGAFEASAFDTVCRMIAEGADIADAQVSAATNSQGQATGGWGVNLELDGEGPAAFEAVTRAMSTAFGTEVLYTREGGSGPEADLQDVLEAPVVFLGVSLPDDGWHAPNEKVEIPLLLKGAEATAHLWDELATALRR